MRIILLKLHLRKSSPWPVSFQRCVATLQIFIILNLKNIIFNLKKLIILNNNPYHPRCCLYKMKILDSEMKILQ